MTHTVSLLSRYEAVRLATMKLAEPLSDEDCCVQSMPEASPVKWHLAHTTWFFETFILERFEPDFKPFDPQFRYLFNSYYNGIGEQYPRARRGMITRPTLGQIEDYRQDVDARLSTLLIVAGAPSRNLDPELERLVTLGLHHEQQHQELILTDVLHLFWQNPLRPAYHQQAVEPVPSSNAQDLDWLTIDAGIVHIGHQGTGFCFDNELPRHRQYLEPFQIASRLVSNSEYLEFIRAGGYQDPALWLSEGWAWLHGGDTPIQAPLYWEQREQVWCEFSLDGLASLDGNRAVRHLSYFEADAYARWVNARLPTEAEWEHAVETQTANKTLTAQADTLLVQLFDTAWQWTSSSYAPYPGFTPAQGSIGEYNGKFMVNQYVLRGGSCATPADHSRPSYRNFFPSNARWQYTGLRLARTP